MDHIWYDRICANIRIRRRIFTTFNHRLCWICR